MYKDSGEAVLEQCCIKVVSKANQSVIKLLLR